MATIEITYRSYVLRMDEYSEKWECRDLDVLDCASLKICKAAVDRLSAADRRLDVNALVLCGHRGNYTIEEAIVALLCEPRKGWDNNQETSVKQVWVVQQGGQRKKRDIEQIYPLGARADLEQLLKLEAFIRTAVKAKETHHDAIERYNADTLVLAAREAKAVKAEV